MSGEPDDTVPVAFLGPWGTFCEQALRSLEQADLADAVDAAPGAVPVPVPAASTTAALDAVRDGGAVAACVPIENSVEGAVPATMDGLVETPPLVITREILVAVRFAVLVRPGTEAADVGSVASHPHGEAQTRRWIAAHLPRAEVRLTSSTAAAAAQVAAGEVDAAVCAPVAAEHHRLAVLASGVHDTGDAVTRFVVVRPPGHPLPPATGTDRTSLAVTTVNRPGSLIELLTELAIRGVDLSRIESRPSKARLGEYWFFLDGSGHVAEPAMGEALAALRRRSLDVRFLGSYPRAATPCGHAGPEPGAPPDGRASADFLASEAWVANLRAGREA